MSDILALTLVCFAVSVCVFALLVDGTPCTLTLHAVVMLLPSQLLLVLFLVGALLVDVGHKNMSSGTGFRSIIRAFRYGCKSALHNNFYR